MLTLRATTNKGKTTMKRVNSSGTRVSERSPRVGRYVHNMEFTNGKTIDRGFERKWMTLRPGQSIAYIVGPPLNLSSK